MDEVDDRIVDQSHGDCAVDMGSGNSSHCSELSRNNAGILARARLPELPPLSTVFPIAPIHRKHKACPPFHPQIRRFPSYYDDSPVSKYSSQFFPSFEDPLPAARYQGDTNVTDFAGANQHSHCSSNPFGFSPLPLYGYPGLPEGLSEIQRKTLESVPPQERLLKDVNERDSVENGTERDDRVVRTGQLNFLEKLWVYLCFPYSKDLASAIKYENIRSEALYATPAQTAAYTAATGEMVFGSELIYFTGPNMEYLVISNEHNVERLVARKMFSQAKYASFARQLNIYRFQRPNETVVRELGVRIPSGAKVWKHESITGNSTLNDCAAVVRNATNARRPSKVRRPSEELVRSRKKRRTNPTSINKLNLRTAINSSDERLNTLQPLQITKPPPSPSPDFLPAIKMEWGFSSKLYPAENFPESTSVEGQWNGEGRGTSSCSTFGSVAQDTASVNFHPYPHGRRMTSTPPGYGTRLLPPLSPKLLPLRHKHASKRAYRVDGVSSSCSQHASSFDTSTSSVGEPSLSWSQTTVRTIPETSFRPHSFPTTFNAGGPLSPRHTNLRNYSLSTTASNSAPSSTFVYRPVSESLKSSFGWSSPLKGLYLAKEDGRSEPVFKR